LKSIVAVFVVVNLIWFILFLL